MNPTNALITQVTKMHAMMDKLFPEQHPGRKIVGGMVDDMMDVCYKTWREATWPRRIRRVK